MSLLLMALGTYREISACVGYVVFAVPKWRLPSIQRIQIVLVCLFMFVCMCVRVCVCVCVCVCVHSRVKEREREKYNMVHLCLRSSVKVTIHMELTF